jgi:hypothetical protein
MNFKGRDISVFDIDWFLSILDKPDMAYICQKFKLTVTGFQRNLNNAPTKSLGNTIKTAINNGFQKKKGNKNDHLPFEEMFADIVKDLMVKHPYISELSFMEFAVRAELEQDLRKYEIVSIAYLLFPKEFEEHYDTIVINTNEGRYIFYGLSEELSKTALEKINTIVGANNLYERNIKLLKEFGNDLQSTKGVFAEIGDLMENEESTLRVLAKAEKDMHVYILVAFLLTNERYKDENYKDLIQTAAYNVQSHKLERLNLTIEEKESELKNIEIKLQLLVDENNRLEKDNTGLLARINTQLETERVLEETVESQKDKLAALENVLHKNEPLQMVFLRIITENNFIIVTKDVTHFVGTPFESVTILPSQFKKEIKTKTRHLYSEQTVFVTRSSFSTGAEWHQFNLFLEKHQLRYEELGQYEITCYIQEIIQHLSRKEVLVYADEI